MLRRKIIIIFGSLVTLLVLTAVGAIYLLQGRLAELRHISEQAWVAGNEANSLANNISVIELELFSLDAGEQRHLDDLLDALDAMRARVDRLESSYITHLAENEPILLRIRAKLTKFEGSVSELGTAQDEGWAARYRRDAKRTALELRRDILALSESLKHHTEEEQSGLTTRFRALVFGLSVVFLLLINIAVLLLLRMASMVLRPVEKLVEATRHLARERYDHRVTIDEKGEFGELAEAYNSLAAHLSENEQRKLEMLGQVALTLNHEINNAASIIELQLQLLSRQSSGNPQMEKFARQIRNSLERMTRTVEALKHVRRIVLTDYVSGVKMLDLERSVLPAEPVEEESAPASDKSTAP